MPDYDKATGFARVSFLGDSATGGAYWGSFTPTKGLSWGGQTVTFKGVGFSSLDLSQLQIYFGEALATNLALVDDHTLTAVTPAHAVGEVVVKATFGSETYQFPSNYQFTQSIDYDNEDNNATLVHTFTAPANVLYQLEAWGAAGGGSSELDSPTRAGFGGYTKGSLYLRQDETLYIYLGVQGRVGANSVFNGGGNYGNDNSGSGGGATDFRLVSGAWNDDLSLDSRIMVAAGGGGMLDYTNSHKQPGHHGGGLRGSGVLTRSEERRVGKECRSRWSPYH